MLTATSLASQFTLRIEMEGLLHAAPYVIEIALQMSKILYRLSREDKFYDTSPKSKKLRILAGRVV